jgi:excisionase family DNA binding protein
MATLDYTIGFSDEDRKLLRDFTEQLRIRNEIDSPDRLLSCGEAANELGVTRQTISTMIRDKRLTKVERGGRTGILLSELRAIKRLL